MYILLTIFWVVGLVAIIIAYDSIKSATSEPLDGFMFFLGVLLMIAGTFGLSHEMNKDGYKQGQIDALNGEYKYEMKVKQDTSYVEVSD